MKIKSKTIEFKPSDLHTITNGLKCYIDLVIQSEVKSGETYKEFIDYMGDEINVLDKLCEGEYVTPRLGVEQENGSVLMIGNYKKVYLSYSERYEQYWKELTKYYKKLK